MQLRLARTMSGGVEANLAGEEGVGDQPTDEDGHDDGSDNLAQVRRGSEIGLLMRMITMVALTSLPR